MTERMEKLLKAAEIIKAKDDKEIDLDQLVAASLQAGYALGRLSADKPDDEEHRR